MLQLPYKDVDFVFVAGHYDFHREGICRHNGELMQFSCIEDLPDDYGSCGEDCDGCSKCEYEIVCTLEPLTWRQKAWWIWRKKLFELCVSHHWSYPQVQEEYVQNASGIWCKKRSTLQKILLVLYYLPSTKPTRWVSWIRNSWRMG